MPKIPKNIYLIRHAQGMHNVEARYHLFDPELTPLGRQQIQRAQEQVRQLSTKPLTILVSPLRRTLATASLAFGQVPMRAVEEIREHIENPCDKRSTVSELQPEFSHVDFSDIAECDPYDKQTEDYAAITERVCRVAQWLRELPGDDIVLVTHFGFINYFVRETTGVSNLNLGNCEFYHVKLEAGP